MKRLYTFFAGMMAFILLSVSSCHSPQKETGLSDNRKTASSKRNSIPSDTTLLEFEKKAYFKISAIYLGNVYTNKQNKEVFYRVLEIPEEENILLIAENITIGEEGGSYKLIKRIRLTDDNSVFPKFGLNKIDSLKFIDSVTIKGYFNGEKRIINVDSIKG